MKHVLIKEQPICETTFFVAGVDEMTRSAFRGIDCAPCLQQALAASEARTRVILQLIAQLEVTP